MAKNYAYLINVNANANSNKFYEITLNEDYSIDVNYGRVGMTSMAKHYTNTEKDFFELITEKIKKGYEDRTALHSELNSGNNDSKYEPVSDKIVQEVLERLNNSSRDFMKKNYTVSAMEITPKMIEEAENDISILNEIANSKTPNTLYYFNKKLQELFTDIPRVMKRVNENLALTEKDFETIINREQEMLDNVKGSIALGKEQEKGTVLDAYDISMRPVTYGEEDQIIAHLGYDYDGRQIENRYVRAFAVENKQTRDLYEKYKQQHNMNNKDVRLFYHGSKTENWMSILKTGLLLNPNALTTGKMFGQGLYFAPECRKTLNYMDVKGSHWNNGSAHTGYTAIYSVALGRCYQPDYILGPTFRAKDLPYGTNSVFAKKDVPLALCKGGSPCQKLKNDEYIVFDQAACTIKYLMEITEQNIKTKEFNLSRNILRNNICFDSLIRTEHGIKAEVISSQMPISAQTEFEAKITNDYDYKHLFIDYNHKTDSISLEIETLSGKIAAIQPNLTKDDYAFLFRELKKSIVSSETEWNKVLNDIIDYPIGKEVFTEKSQVSKENKNNKEKE